ncbi:MAG: hypothetical protein ACREP6_11210 [Candidatus Binataceae bacterium]
MSSVLATAAARPWITMEGASARDGVHIRHKDHYATTASAAPARTLQE